MLADKEPALRGFCARILGWSSNQATAVENALGLIHFSIAQRAPLVLLGDTDLVPIAHALHRRTIGAERPFVVCDPRRGNVRASVRCPMSRESGIAALQAAHGGSLCVRSPRVPRDFSSVVARMRDPAADVRLIVCAGVRHVRDPFLVLAAPIRVPSLRTRASELSRIVDEYALDAIRTLGADDACFTAADRRWVLAHAAGTWSEVEKATLRLVALKMSKTLPRAAKQLGISHAALGQWLDRRGIQVSRRGLRAATSAQRISGLAANGPRGHQ